jgi:hypothetical protein
LESLKRSTATLRDTDEVSDRPESHPRTVDIRTRELEEEEVSAADLAMAMDIAEFIAKRAFEFDDHEARAWALTDFGVWAVLAGESPELSFEPTKSDRP